MKYKRIVSLSLFVVILLSVFSLTVSAAVPPETEATSALLIERNSGRVLYEKDPQAKVYPASMTKIMTCLLGLEHLRLSDTVTVSETALEGLSEDGSTANLKVGETINVEDLLYCLMISSANEASNVVAEAVSGSVESFVALMNRRALELGCKNTHFANPHGLHDDDHYTTAEDLLIIAEAALKNSIFRAIVSTASCTVAKTNLSDERKLKTTNQMIVNSTDNPYYDARVSGIKTGYTTPAGRCLIASAQSGTISLLSVVCGCQTRILPSGDLEFGSFTDTKRLLDFAFDNYEYATILDTLYPMTEIPVRHANSASSVALAPVSSLGVLLPKDYDESLLSYEIHTVAEDGIEAPVAAGDVLGSVNVRYAGEELGNVELAAITDITRKAFLSTSNGMSPFLIVLIVVGMLFALVLLILILNAKRRDAQRRRLRRSGEVRHG